MLMCVFAIFHVKFVNVYISIANTVELIYFDRLGTSRRFYVVLNYNGCPGDRLYTMTLTWHEFSCGYDTYATYPQFVYANTASPGYPETNTGIFRRY